MTQPFGPGLQLTGVKPAFPLPAGARESTREHEDDLASDMTSAGQTDHADMVRQARSGNAEAVRRLYMACSVVYPYICRKYRDQAFAREVFHDTVTEIWRGSAMFEARSKFSTWVIGIACNVAASALRKRGRLEAEPMPDAAGDEEADADAAAHDLDPLHHLSRRREREAILACIRKLSPKLGEMLLLVYYADMQQAEIASMLELNINTVKTRIRDAHLRVRSCLDLRLGRA